MNTKDSETPKSEWEEQFRKQFGGQKFVYANEETILDFIHNLLQQQIQEDIEKLEKERKTGNNGEGLPYENSPEIYGNQRIEAYKNGYNQALDTLINYKKDQLTK